MHVDGVEQDDVRRQTLLDRERTDDEKPEGHVVSLPCSWVLCLVDNQNENILSECRCEIRDAS